jgi:hypothetical protein
MPKVMAARWVETEMVGDKVTIEVREVIDHHRRDHRPRRL